MVPLNFLYLLFMMPPLALMAILLDRKARKIILFLLAGMLTAFLSGQINTLIISLTGVSESYACIHYTPIVEELLKAFPVVTYALAVGLKRKETVEYAAAVGLGFAIFENVWAISQSAIGVPNWGDITFALSRGFGASMIHALCTVILANGFSICLKRRKLFLTGTFALLSLVCLFHSLFNVLVGSSHSFLALVLTLGVYVVILILIKRRRTTKEK